MKIVSTIFLIIAILASFSIPTVSQQHQPSESKETKASDYYAMGYGHGNPRALSDQLIPQPKTEKQKQEGERIKLGEAIGLIIAGLVAIFNYLLWRTTKDLWAVTREQADATQKAADAALKSADVAERSLLGLEAPFLFVVNHTDPGISRLDIEFGFEYFLHNSGRSPAIIEAVIDEVFLMPPLRKVPEFTIKKNVRIGQTIVAAGVTTLDMPVKIGRKLTPEEKYALVAKSLELHHLGRIRYRDTMGYLHTFTFAEVYVTDKPGDETGVFSAIMTSHDRKKVGH